MIFRNLIALLGLTLTLAACDTYRYGPQYWQRFSASEAVYQQGPKADQMLDRDIGRCVIELKELESLGLVKEPLMMDRDGRVLDPDEIKKEEKKLPKPHANISVTEYNFRDFPSCMKAKGWERVYAAQSLR